GRSSVEALTGPEEVRRLLTNIDLSRQIDRLNRQCVGPQARELWELLQWLQHFRASEARLDWVALDALPVLPYWLRAGHYASDGSFHSDDRNELYRRVLEANAAIKDLLRKGIPRSEVWIKSGRTLQDAVDRLFLTGCVDTNYRPARRLSPLIDRVLETLHKLR